MRWKLLLIILTISACLAVACSGTMKGLDRYTGKRVFFNYEDQKFGSANIHITMPDGEKFQGKLGEAPDTKQSGMDYSAVDEFPGNAEAYLYGDRGTEMRCKFRLSDTMLGFKGGGFGLCETSNDHVIDIYLR